MKFAALLASAASSDPVTGSTHEYYRYPARFSPQFALAAIESLSEPGQTVFDPFMGGGTSAVEALATGRRFVGCDINPLSVFVASIKTTPLTDCDLEQVITWSQELMGEADFRSRTEPDWEWQDYQINLPWWIRNALEVALNRLNSSLHSERTQQFARCVLLKTGQWALDCRRHLPSVREFLERLVSNSEQMSQGMREYRNRLSEHGVRPSEVGRKRRVIVGDAAAAIGTSKIPAEWVPPRLILTSPPYLGIHILYHRWQVRGRRETSAPFWIANSLDGFGASHYTFGDRQRKEAGMYWGKLKSCLAPLVNLMDNDSLLVQLVAFANPETQLKPYIETLQSVGLVEAQLHGSNRKWRDVPNRKWYAQLRRGSPSSKEVLLVHRKS